MNASDKFSLALTMIRNARNRYGTGYLPLLTRFLMVTRRKFSPVEIAQSDLLNVTRKTPSLDDFISKENLLAIQARLNPQSLSDETENKKRFDEICRRHGLPVPEIVAELVAEPGSTQVRQSDGPESPWGVLDVLTKVPADRYVIKPANGCSGEGIHVFELPQAAPGRQRVAAELEHHLSKFGKYRHWLIQERLENHDQVMAICSSEALQTIRVVTYLDRDRVPHLLAAQWRLAGPESEVDNFFFGVNANLLCNVDIDTGGIEVVFRGKNFPFEFGLERFTRHPESGTLLEGCKVPFWDEVVSLTKRAAVVFYPSRSIGWDIALSNRGLAIIEGNRYWDPHNEDARMRERVVTLTAQI
jgi:hypothetical protein